MIVKSPPGQHFHTEFLSSLHIKLIGNRKGRENRYTEYVLGCVQTIRKLSVKMSFRMPLCVFFAMGVNINAHTKVGRSVLERSNPDVHPRLIDSSHYPRTRLPSTLARLAPPHHCLQAGSVGTLRPTSATIVLLSPTSTPHSLLNPVPTPRPHLNSHKMPVTSISTPNVSNQPLETVKLSETIHRFRPSKAFQNISQGSEITSLDFDDKGELCLASSTDETLQLYDCGSGRHQKTLYSKKYGCHLAKFSHTSTNVVYASTKGDDTIRYLSLHDNTYIRYFRGHRRIVNSLEVSPINDQFISSSYDDTVRLWDLRSPNCHGVLNLTSPSLAAFDPTGIVFAVASHAAQSIMLYDLRNYDKQPFTTFTLTDDSFLSSFSYPPRMPPWSKLEFSNDGKHMLLGTRGHAHYIVDSFAENTSKFLYRVHRPRGPTNPTVPETGGDVCFTPDGRYIVGGHGDRGVSVWDTAVPADEKKTLKPVVDLAENGRSMAACVAFNPKTNLFASANKEVVSFSFLIFYSSNWMFGY